jgi:site-specific DNA-adenine methylase
VLLINERLRTLPLQPERTLPLQPNGGINVPFGKYCRITYVRDFSAYMELFSEWEFSPVDFEKLNLNPDDFVYADLPYDVEFTQYAKGEFTWQAQVRLPTWLAAHPTRVVLSNQATPRIVKLYRRLGFTSASSTLHDLSTALAIGLRRARFWQ